MASYGDVQLPRAVGRLVKLGGRCAEHGRYLRPIEGTAVHDDDGSVCLVHVEEVTTDGAQKCVAHGLPMRQVRSNVWDASVHRDGSPCVPLGLASTKELLEELQRRFAMATPVLAMALDQVMDLKDGLSPETLAYRTVNK